MLRAADKWMVGYLLSVLRRRRTSGPRRLIFCVADHFEPFRGGTLAADARRNVREWCDRYERSVLGFHDANGRAPRHTCFYPEEEYDAACLEALGDLSKKGFGEVEIHLHHRHDTAEGLRSKLVAYRDRLREQHGMLGEWGKGQEVRGKGQEVRDRCSVFSHSHTPILPHPRSMPAYGFVHGNWALCNARPDGDWCGVNEELGILEETGCYADFTFPSAPSPTQSRMVNAIYRASDQSGRPRGHDRGERVQVGERAPPHTPALLLIQGPLALDWGRRKWGILPRLENGEISGGNPPIPARVDLWARQCIHVAGRPDWVFVKVHTHGLVGANTNCLLGEPMRRMHAWMSERYNDGKRWTLHYVTAREMCNLVEAAAAGARGDPGPWRDYAVSPPPGAGGP